MKIAIAALKKDETSQVSDQAARAPFFLVFDGQGALVETVKNPFRLGGGAGFAVAKLLADRGIDTFIAARIGDKMTAALRERGIIPHEMTGMVSDAVSEILRA
ncbi:MAG: NifB/NifX family molybdenum-iron cluster-binding protein [Spirochaetes bacterium]|nr:NifB/NifX family molybdenum-iron cluster-binding protein [Spirochaetota bacterium]